MFLFLIWFNFLNSNQITIQLLILSLIRWSLNLPTGFMLLQLNISANLFLSLLMKDIILHCIALGLPCIKITLQLHCVKSTCFEWVSRWATTKRVTTLRLLIPSFNIQTLKSCFHFLFVNLFWFRYFIAQFYV